MKILKQAEAIVIFRVLRSVGHFFPRESGSKHFIFYPCNCRSPKTETLPNGLPETMRGLTVNELVKTYFLEIEALCPMQFPNWSHMAPPTHDQERR